MKNHLKLMAVLSVSAILSAAAPELGFSAAVSNTYAEEKGWVQENGSWRFYEDSETYVTDAWKKRGEDWYYLDEDGDVSVNTAIEEYYVDKDGKRVSEQWVSVSNEDFWDYPDAPEFLWHYYGKNGKEIVSKLQKVKNYWYYFNDQGVMTTGKTVIDGNTYYFGAENDVVMKTGWVFLENESEELEDDYSWYYFDKNGHMVENQVDKKINALYYTFENGIMQTGWYKLPETATGSETSQNKDTAASYQYYDKTSGARISGWAKTEGIPELSEEGEIYTFYFKNGAPYFAEKGLELFTIEGKKYAFNTSGEMQTGLQAVEQENGTHANYYFGTDGVMATGKQTIYNEDLDEDQVWYFQTEGSYKGQGFHGVRDNTLYEQGLRKQADSDLKLAPVSFEGKWYLVNASGSLQKATASSKSAVKPKLGAGYKDFKDANGGIWVTDVNGVLH